MRAVIRSDIWSIGRAIIDQIFQPLDCCGTSFIERCRKFQRTKPLTRELHDRQCIQQHPMVIDGILTESAVAVDQPSSQALELLAACAGESPSARFSQ